MTPKYPGLRSTALCLPGLQSNLGLLSPALIFLIAWNVVCNLVWVIPTLLSATVGVCADVPPLLFSRFKAPLQLVARPSAGALLLVAADKRGAGLVTTWRMVDGRVDLHSMLGLTIGLEVGSANFRVTCDPPSDS